MPKKAKRGRPPGKKAEKKTKSNAGFWRGVAAVALIIFGVVLLFGAFISAPIPHELWNGFWWAFGSATIVAPFIFIYLGMLKFINEEQRIPFANMAGTIGLLVFLSSFMYTAFMPDGHGGHVGETVGNVLVNSLGQFLAGLIFFLLTIFSILFTFAINPRSILELFKREPREDNGEEDLASLKTKMQPDFQLHEGVPTEHSPSQGRMTSLRGAAQKVAPEAAAVAALTTARDPDWQFPSLELLSSFF
ncbi:DNA translocase FtsK 4TM domain-containing protein, partial [Candidatus Saccharibacteria bacterium]|nr:DNA translocase FtsK 4TM domain-containing protein [Candidatus Saccharibacteria bacterium]